MPYTTTSSIFNNIAVDCLMIGFSLPYFSRFFDQKVRKGENMSRKIIMNKIAQYRILNSNVMFCYFHFFIFSYLINAILFKLHSLEKLVDHKCSLTMVKTFNKRFIHNSITFFYFRKFWLPRVWRGSNINH